MTTLPESTSPEQLPVSSPLAVSPPINPRPSSRSHQHALPSPLPRVHHDRELSDSDWGDDSISTISTSATTLTMGSTYSESGDEDEYGGGDGEYDSFRDEFDDADEDDDSGGRLELDGRGRLRSVSVAARADSRLGTRRAALEDITPIQGESPFRDPQTLQGSTQPQPPQARRRHNPSQPDEGSETDEAPEVQNSSFTTVRNARHRGLNDAKSPPPTAVPLQTTPSSSSAPSRLPPVPLKPFRNQVGGHSAIYKFTKRAVCKVCPIAKTISRY